MNCWSSTSPTAGPGWPSVVPAAGAPPCSGPSWARPSTASAPTSCTCTSSRSGGGSLVADAAVLPHAGTTVAGEDALRTVRLIDRLAREVAARRAGPAPGRYPLILLLVDGVEALSTVLDDADPARGSASLLRLLRDGAAVGLTCVATADRAVPGGRLAAAARQRLVLPLPDRADYAVAGISARAVPERRLAGRALVGEEAQECQLTLPRPLEAAPLDGTGTSTPPFPPPVRISGAAARAGADAADPAGRAPRDCSPSRSDQAETRETRWSSTSCAPVACSSRARPAADARRPSTPSPSTLRPSGPACCASGSRRHPPGTVLAAPDVRWLDPADDAGARAWAAGLGDRPGVVIADDVGTPAECAALGALPGLGVRTGVALVAAASPGQLSGHYQGPIAALRRSRAALLLCPGPGDADLLGIRLPRTPLPLRPGSGWLLIGTAMERVQVARRQPPVPRSPR